MVKNEWFFYRHKTNIDITALKGYLNMWPTCQAD